MYFKSLNTSVVFFILFHFISVFVPFHTSTYMDLKCVVGFFFFHWDAQLKLICYSKVFCLHFLFFERVTSGRFCLSFQEFWPMLSWCIKLLLLDPFFVVLEILAGSKTKFLSLKRKRKSSTKVRENGKWDLFKAWCCWRHHLQALFNTWLIKTKRKKGEKIA